MTIARLAPTYRGRVVVPVLGKVTVTGCTDRVAVRLVSGQSPADFADRAEGIAHGFRAHLCRVRTGKPGLGGPGAGPPRRARRARCPPWPFPSWPTCGRCRSASARTAALFTVRLAGTHLLIAGATGRGQGLLPVGPGPGHAARDGGRAGPGLGLRPEADGAGVRPGAVRPLRPVRRRPGRHRRPARRRRRRDAGQGRAGSRAASATTPRPAEFPFVVVLVDEIAFLTAYQADRKLRERILAALATLTTQGRAVGLLRGRRAAGPAQGSAQHPQPVPRQDRAAAGRAVPGGHGARRRRPRPRRVLRRDLHRPGDRRGSRATSAWRPPPTRCGSGPRSSPTTTSAP